VLRNFELGFNEANDTAVRLLIRVSRQPKRLLQLHPFKCALMLSLCFISKMSEETFDAAGIVIATVLY